MPAKGTAVPAKRKATTFKPPRPAAKSKGSASKATPRRKSAPARAVASHSSSDDEAEVEAPQTSSPRATTPTAALQDAPSAIPPELLITLLQHHFQDKQFRIKPDANAVVGKYMDTFVREAIARAAYERTETAGEQGSGGDFLEVEDLEKLAPQLILDF